jgi:hypothetical protein
VERTVSTRISVGVPVLRRNRSLRICPFWETEERQGRYQSCKKKTLKKESSRSHDAFERLEKENRAIDEKAGQVEVRMPNCLRAATRRELGKFSVVAPNV